MKKYLYKTLGIFACMMALTFASCEVRDLTEADLFTPDTQEAIDAIISDGEEFSFHKLQDVFMTEKGNYYDTALAQFYRTRANCGDDVWYFSIDTFPSNGPGIYVIGRVCTDDQGGNNYKTLILQQIDSTGEQQNLRIGVDVGSIGGLYPMGQKVAIRCNGLAIGRYANQVQLCVPSYNNNIYANNQAEKIGWAASRIPNEMFRKATTRIGVPDQSKLVYDELTLDDIKSKYYSIANKPKECRKMDARLIRIMDVHFNGYADDSGKPVKTNPYVMGSATDSIGNPSIDPYTNVFAPTTNNMNYPQGRYITNSTGSVRFIVGTSEFAKYSNYFLPSHITRSASADPKASALDFNYEACQGYIEGVIGFYVDNAGKFTSSHDTIKYNSWSISLNSMEDIHFMDTISKEPWKPVEFSKHLFE